MAPSPPKKALDKIQHLSVEKASDKLRKEGNFFKRYRLSMEKLKSICNDEKSNVLYLRSGTKGCLFSMHQFNILLEVLARTIGQEKEKR